MQIINILLQRSRNKFNQGFTLVELVITIVLVGIIAAAIGGFIGQSMEAYTAITRRGQLVDAADMALRRMSRDMQAAVPNSIRVKTSGSDVAIEFLHAVESIRYRAQGGNQNERLRFNNTDEDFDVMGLLQNVANGVQPYRLVIYNTGSITGSNYDTPTAGINVYNPSTAPGPFPPAGSHVINTASQTITFSTNGSNSHVNISAPGMQFALESPMQRLYIADTPYTYLCSPSPSGGTITLFSGYALQSTQPINAGAAPLSTATTQAPLTGNVSACTFTYTQGTAQLAGVVTMIISLTSSGETITLMRQVSADDAP